MEIPEFRHDEETGVLQCSCCWKEKLRWNLSVSSYFVSDPFNSKLQFGNLFINSLFYDPKVHLWSMFGCSRESINKTVVKAFKNHVYPILTQCCGCRIIRYSLMITFLAWGVTTSSSIGYLSCRFHCTVMSNFKTTSLARTGKRKWRLL